MPYIVKIAAYIIPILIRFVDRHSDSWLDGLYKKIKNMLGMKEIVTTLYFVNGEGNPVHGAIIEYIAGKYGLVQKPSTKDGSVELYGFTEGDEVNATVYFGENEKSFITIEINDVELKRIVL